MAPTATTSSSEQKPKVALEILRLDRCDKPACVDQKGHVHVVVGEEPPQLPDGRHRTVHGWA